MLPVQMEEVVGLDQPVVELDEVEAGGFQPGLVRLGGQHLVDREVATDVSQKRNVFEAKQPLGVVERYRGGVVAELAAVVVEVAVKLLGDEAEVVLQILFADQLARGGSPAGIADHRGAAAAERDGTVPHPLQRAEHHHADHVPGMERGTGGIEPLVERDGTGFELGAKAVLVGDVVDEAARPHVVDWVDAGIPRQDWGARVPGGGLFDGGGGGDRLGHGRLSSC